MVRLIVSILASYILFGACVYAGTSTVSPQEKEIRYRDIYFYYYNKDFFTAVSLLKAEMEMNRLANGDDILLLLGLLYMGYGLAEEGEGVLAKISTSPTSSQKHKNLALFYLARHYYKQNQFAQSNALLTKVNKTLLSQRLLPEFSYIKFYVSLMLYGNEGAGKIIRDIPSDTRWLNYASYNYGTSLIKSGKLVDGIAYLRRLGKSSQSVRELVSLSDKANTALGFYYLDERKPQQAISAFERVSLDGVFSNKAMLGMGWGYSQLGDYEEALVPWIRLSKQEIHETTVQEGMLASAFALQKVGAMQQALDNYQNAITIYEFLKEGIANTMHRIRSGQVTSALFDGDDYSDGAISQRLIGVLRREQGNLLGKLLQDREFQEAFNQYRDLRYLDNKLQIWHAQTRQFSGLSFEQDKRTVFADELNIRVEDQSTQIAKLLKDYESAIQDKMVEILDQQNLFVSNYLSQARFAVAQILDQQSTVMQ